MTAVLDDLDLEHWVTFSAGDRLPCCWDEPEPCTAVAVALAVWAKDCGHEVTPAAVCARHRDMIAEAAEGKRRRLGCRHCGATVRLLRFEPLR